MTRNERVKHAISEKKTPQRAIAEFLDVRIATVNNNLNAKEEINSIEFIEAVSQLTGFSKIWLCWGIGKKLESEENEWRDNYTASSTYVANKDEQINNLNRTLRMMHQINDQKNERIKELEDIIRNIGGDLPPEKTY